MKKKTKRTISRVILGATALLVLVSFILPLTVHDINSVGSNESAIPSTPPVEKVVPETTEQDAIVIPEPDCEPVEPIKPILENPEPTVERYSNSYSYTPYELDLLARLIQSEGGGESYETKLKIASVVMNRVTDSRFSNTIEEVIYEPRQFSVTILKIDGVAMIDYPASEESKKAAKDVLDNGSVLPPDVLFFYATYCKEPWLVSRAIYGTFDSTVFAYPHSQEV